MEYHISKTGNDRNTGTFNQPFLTIGRGAEIARPGDTVSVHAGIYRELVSPARGGENDLRRIIYRAAPGECVVIKGSEPITGWAPVGGDVWSVTLPDTLFGEFNPYRELLHGDWFIDEGRVHHLGEIFVNGLSLYEVDSLEEVRNPQPWDKALTPSDSLRVWHCEEKEGNVLIHANFQGADPNAELVEATARPACFYPKTTGINFISVSGFEMCQAATPWAPPTAEQIGIVGPHWAKGWIIENNHIHDAKCSGISLGKERSTGQNLWSELRVKHGTQRERETVLQAVNKGWSRDSVGSHVVRNNTIHDCEQTGICGHLGAIFSRITGNHIHHIHVRRRFRGHEMAGIKIHAPIDTLIEGNYVHHTYQGIWLDWQAQGSRVSRNLLHDNALQDVYVEVSHGPYVVDNNILLSECSISDCSQGGAFVHNLIGGRIRRRSIPNRFTFYHVPHSTAVAGLMTILGGDNRFFNNLLAPQVPIAEQKGLNAADETAEIKGKKAEAGTGLAQYDDFPAAGDDWCQGRTVDDYAAMRLPVWIGSNLHFRGSPLSIHEKETSVSSDHDPGFLLEERDGAVFLRFSMDESMHSLRCPPITTAFLGSAFQAETPFDDFDGRPLALNGDYSLAPRPEVPTVGPFENFQKGENFLKVWPVC